MRELAAIRRRFGYRRLLILMRREGLTMNHKKFRRLYREERLQVRRRGGRKRALGTRTPLAIQRAVREIARKQVATDINRCEIACSGTLRGATTSKV